MFLRGWNRQLQPDGIEARTGLVLGPFSGKLAWVRIPLGKGVCGTAAAARRETVLEPKAH